MEQSTLKLPATAGEPRDAALVASGNGSALYVINLCASMAPIAHTDKPLPGFEQYRVYQVSRKEDGRIRYRLRLGFFGDEAEAETALACIREQYPTAFATSLCDEDQRHTRGFASSGRPAAVSQVSVSSTQPSAPPPTKAESVKAAVPPPANMAKPSKAAQPAKAATLPPQPSKPQADKPAPAVSDTQRVPALKLDKPLQIEVEWEEPLPTIAATARAAEPIVQKAPAQPTTKPASAPPSSPVAAPAARAAELTLANDLAVPPAVAPSTPTNEPFHVGKGVAIPTSTLSLEPESPAQKPAATPAANRPATPQPPKASPAVPTKQITQAAATVKGKAVEKPIAAMAKTAPAKPVAPPMLPKPPVVLGNDMPLPDLDSTQTIRALTAAELDDEAQPKWFAVQLAVSEQPINLDTMPHLDIFSAYRLYSVASAGGGKILHHMRIGFFKEAVSAEAVCGYLKTFFGNPTVLRISVAEQTRFAEAPVKPAPAEAKAKVIDIAAARERTPAQEIPVVTMEVTPNPAASGRYPKPNTANSGRYSRPNTGASGLHKQPAAAKTAARSAATTRTAKPGKSTSASGKHRSLQEALLAEAREVALSESAIRRLPKNSSLLGKLFGKK